MEIPTVVVTAEQADAAVDGYIADRPLPPDWSIPFQSADSRRVQSLRASTARVREQLERDPGPGPVVAMGDLVVGHPIDADARGTVQLDIVAVGDYGPIITDPLVDLAEIAAAITTLRALADRAVACADVDQRPRTADRLRREAITLSANADEFEHELLPVISRRLLDRWRVEAAARAPKRAVRTILPQVPVQIRK